MHQRTAAFTHLRSAYPHLDRIFETVGEVDLGAPGAGDVAEKVVEIIVGQMLSGTAADTIYGRLKVKAAAMCLSSTHALPVEEIRACGVSGRKAQAIGMFSQTYIADPARFTAWASLDYPALKKDVSSLWGLSEWSASILALSHFAMPDVWPSADGSIKRAVSMIELASGVPFDPDLGAPFRSYLARSLWASLDSGLLHSQDSFVSN